MENLPRQPREDRELDQFDPELGNREGAQTQSQTHLYMPELMEQAAQNPHGHPYPNLQAMNAAAVAGFAAGPLMRFRESHDLRIMAKKEALEFMLERLMANDSLWKVVDLEEYTMENPDVVITDAHIFQLAECLRINTHVVALRLPENNGLVTWNVLWPLFESIKMNTNLTRLFIGNSGKVFGHAASVFLTNSILGFFSHNYTLRTLGSFSKSEGLKRTVRVALNRNILHHYVPKKVSILRRLWQSAVEKTSVPSLESSGNDALSLLYEFDEHLNMIKMLAQTKGVACPKLLGSDISLLSPSSSRKQGVLSPGLLREDSEQSFPCGSPIFLSVPSRRPFSQVPGLNPDAVSLEDGAAYSQDSQEITSILELIGERLEGKTSASSEGGVRPSKCRRTCHLASPH